jgi:MerR HTH family regulatory protein
MTETNWTLDELTERVGAALSVGYDGQPSGRVRDLPDQRAIRWYTTIGLVDRPAAMRGRTAMYGPRHLLQLVAIKRLQAEGRSLVAIQAELAGATDTRLARVAQLAEAPVARGAPFPRRAGADHPRGSADGPGAAPARGAAAAPGHEPAEAPARGPAAIPHRGPAAAPALAPGPATPLPGAGPATPVPGAGPAAPLPGAGPATGDGGVRPARFWRDRPVDATAAAAAPLAESSPLTVEPAPPVATLQGVPLGERATLLLGAARPLDGADLRAILDAARPLLEALRARGLDGGPGGPHPGREHP